jgi:uncharacterized membrane protein YphA (DoxX/SURF4 family)
VLGLGTRIVAPVLAIEMVVAFFKAHLPRGGVPLQNGVELGGGAWSVDDYMFKATDRGRSLHG